MPSTEDNVASTGPGQAGDGLIFVGAIVAGIGALATLVSLVPLVVGTFSPPPWLWFVAIGGVGVGVGMSLWGVVRSARARSRYLHNG